tara:strand:+ start:248 stop:2008 length:1761 start_codon:yes stop_codon:yes gene_type:complete
MIPIKKFNSLLNFGQKKSVIFLLFLILIGMSLETLGVGLIIPIFTIIMDPNIAAKYPTAAMLLSNLSPLKLFFNDNQNISSQALLISGAIIIIILVYSVKACFLVFLSWRQSTFVTKLGIGWSDKLFSGYLNLPYSFHLQKNSAFLLRNVNQSLVLANALELTLVLLTEILVVIGIATLLIVTEPLGALVVIITFLISGYFFQRYTKKHLLNWGTKRHFYEGQRIKYMQQGFGGVKDLKLLGREKNFSEEFLKYNNAAAFIARNTKVLKTLPRLWLEIMVVICLSILLFLMLIGQQTINEVIPTLGLFAAASFRLMPSTNKILGNIQELRYSAPVVSSAYEELKKTTPKEILKNTNGVIAFKKSIVLNQIDHTYEGTTKSTLNKVSLNIPFGNMVGFVGESGSGKSTLIDIILGLLNPTNGSVKIDNVDIQKDLRGWQNQIGYVPQDIFLTDDTLRKNVAFAISDKDISDQSVDDAIKGANLEEFVKNLPEGLNTMVGERGVRLSGGQRQRIGIARALYHKPKVLVLDEATSALDVDTENEIMEGITKLKKNKTVLIVSHRLSTVSKCDSLFKLDNGKVVQKDKFE